MLCFPFISLGSRAPHVLRIDMGHTCGGPNEIELTGPPLTGCFPAPFAGCWATDPQQRPYFNELASALLNMYASPPVRLHPNGGQLDFVWLPARTPHRAHVWWAKRNQEKYPPEKYYRSCARAGCRKRVSTWVRWRGLGSNRTACTRREPFNSTHDGGQFDFVWLPARTPHGAYVW